MAFFLYIIDWIFFIPLAACVTYLLFYAIASCFYTPPQFAKAKRKNRFLIVFPAYKEDRVILDSVNSFLKQSYPKECYDIIVVSDQMNEATNNALNLLPITLIKANYRDSSKAKALNLACDTFKDKKFEGIVIMDADNTTNENFLSRINDAFDSGRFVLQACRVGKKASAKIAILDGAGEEINNGIFRAGHNAVGLSAALAGSGMTFEWSWFKSNVEKLKSAGEDKELEQLLLKEEIFITYLSDLPVYDEKTAKLQNFENQRRRWIAVQYATLTNAIGYLPTALRKYNISYCDKIIQWMLPPRLIQLFMIAIFTLLSFFAFDFIIALKWLLLCFLQLLVFLLPLPRGFFSVKLLKAIGVQLPILVFASLKNLFKLKGAHKKFIHTKHGEN